MQQFSAIFDFYKKGHLNSTLSFMGDLKNSASLIFRWQYLVE